MSQETWEEGALAYSSSTCLESPTKLSGPGNRYKRGGQNNVHEKFNMTCDYVQILLKHGPFVTLYCLIEITMGCHIKTVVRTRTLRRALELKPIKKTMGQSRRRRFSLVL
jgi:hypothetical protein